MALHACIEDNKVHSLVDIINEEHYRSLIVGFSNIIDISNIIPQPQVGWLLVGTELTPVDLTPDQIQANLEKNVTGPAVSFGISLKRDVTAKIGAKNLMLNKTIAEISQLVPVLNGIGALLDSGALHTAKDVINANKVNFPEYTAEFDYVINSINSFLGI